jgi:hypothetical protein
MAGIEGKDGMAIFGAVTATFGISPIFAFHIATQSGMNGSTTHVAGLAAGSAISLAKLGAAGTAVAASKAATISIFFIVFPWDEPALSRGRTGRYARADRATIGRWVKSA